MSDGARPPPQRPSPPAGTPSRPPAAPSGPPRVVSAARAQPLAPEPASPLAQRVAGRASDSALNGLALLRELLADFRRRDRFFKYKAGIVATWLLVSAVSVGVACPTDGVRSSSTLRARLVLAGDAAHPVYTLFNDGRRPWTEVTVVVNGRYRATAPRVGPGGNLTLTPGQLVDGDGKVAPPALHLLDLEVRTADGAEVLMRAGALTE